MTCFLFSFLRTTVFWLALAGYGLRKVLSHMRNNPEAAASVTLHVLTPLFGKADESIIDLQVARSEDDPPFTEEDKS